MGSYEAMKLYIDLRSGKKFEYIAIPAFENFDRKKVQNYDICLMEDIVDETDKLIQLIEYYIEKTIIEDHVSSNWFEKFYIKFTPILFYKANTIDDDPEKVVAETDPSCLEYLEPFVKLMIDFVTVTWEDVEVEETDPITGELHTVTKQVLKENYRFGSNPLVGTVDFNNFVRKLNYKISYTEFYKLARDIINFAREDDRFPELYSSIFTEEEIIEYQQDAERQKSL